MTREQELKLALTYLIDAHTAAQRVAAAAQKEVDDLAAAIAKARTELDALTLPPEPSLTDRFAAALNASALPAHAKMGGIESITLVSVFNIFYALAERYGATHPKDIAKLASVITNRKASPFKPPDWMISDDEDKAVIIKSHERRAISQWSGYVHPYTCVNDPCHVSTGGAPLHPKREGGWVCLHCGLHQ